jgi:hypothetical protein
VRSRLARSSVETRREPQTVIKASSFHITADEIAETLIFRALNVISTCNWEQPDTDASRAGIKQNLCSAGFRIAQHHHRANSDCRRGCIRKRQQITAEKFPEARGRICDARVTNT